MKTCSKCGETFHEGEEEHNPFVDLGEMFLGQMDDIDTDDICPKCKEELGIINLLGFGE